MAKPRRARRTLTTLIVLVLVSVTAISLDESGRTHWFTSGVKSAAADIFSPFRSGVNAILDPVGHFFAGAVHYGALEQQNAKLRRQIGALRQDQAAAHYQRRQVQQLQHLLATEKLPSLQGITTVTAQTTAMNVSNYQATITLDKGRSDGVAVTDPVVGAGGLVGRVVAASHSTATVVLVTDGQSQVGVTFGDGVFATLDGAGPGHPLHADFVAANTPVHTGQDMVTDGLQGAQFPAGIPVATVAGVHAAPGATDKTVTARPAADLGSLTYVAVLQWSPTP